MSDIEERLTVRLARSAMDEVREKATSRGLSINEFVRRALGTEVFLIDEIEKGSTIVLERQDKSRAEVLLR